MPFGAVLDILRELGFDGVLWIECRLRGESEAALRECGGYLRELVG